MGSLVIRKVINQIKVEKKLIYLPQKKIILIQKHWLGSVC